MADWTNKQPNTTVSGLPKLSDDLTEEEKKIIGNAVRATWGGGFVGGFLTGGAWVVYYFALRRRPTLWRPKLLETVYPWHLPVGAACTYPIGAFCGAVWGFTGHWDEVNVITTKHTKPKDSPGRQKFQQKGATADRSTLSQQDRNFAAQYEKYRGLEDHELATVTEDGEVIGLDGVSLKEEEESRNFLNRNFG